MFGRKNSAVSSELQLPLGLLASYLFFLLRRPISSSNSHYLAQRIKGLKSLAPVLAGSSLPQIRNIAVKLNSMQPANLSAVARDLQMQLTMEHKPLPVPAEYVVSHRPPGPDLFANVQRVLLALCPAIGIGDEMIYFPVPAWLKATFTQLQVAVMSAYQGLWDRVRAVDDCIYYSTHRELLDVLQGRGQGSLAPYDLVIFGDFEKPGLAPLVCLEPGRQRYVEMSLGGQYAAAVDNRIPYFRSTSLLPEAHISYYAALDRLLEWLGVRTHSIGRYQDAVQHEQLAPADSLRIFVSPFTSKYNPSLIYWSKVLSALCSGRPPVPVEFVVDPGTNLATERFGSALVQSAAARAVPGTSFLLAGQRGQGLALKGVFAEMERSHVVLCADSFAAHAGPLFGCVTLVVAAPGLEKWRTPSPHSYYFDIAQPIDAMVTAMRKVLAHHGGLLPAQTMELKSVLAHDAFRLDDATHKIMSMLQQAGAPYGRELLDAYGELVESYDAVVRNLMEWPDEYSALLADVDYGQTLRQLGGDAGNLFKPDQLEHLKSSLTRWDNTNLRKLLRQVCTRSTATAAGMTGILTGGTAQSWTA